MGNTRVNRGIYLFKLLNVLLVTAVFAGCWVKYYNNIITWSYQYKGNIAMALIFAALYLLFVKVYDAFAVNIQRRMELAISQALSALFSDGLMYVIICLLHEWFAPVWPLVIALLLQILLSLVWVIAANKWYYTNTPKKRALILHDGSGDAEHLYNEMAHDKSVMHITVKDIIDCVEEHMLALDNADVVYICANYSPERVAVIEYCTARKLNFFLVPSINDMLIHSARNVHMFHLPLMQMHMGEPSVGYLFMKRAMDVALSLIALLVLWPVMLTFGIAIKAYDGGPAFYKQTRLTKDGKEFNLIKFRSMRVDAEADGVARLSTGDNDTRITPIGRWIRKLRIDELPQILNIIKGDMSIVGPRPERPEIAAQYEQDLPEFALRLQVKAGLTGYAQVYGKYNSTPLEKLQMDMIYISRPSIIEDIRLIFATIRVLFIKESTEGVDASQVTASK